MTHRLISDEKIAELARKAAGLDQPGGNPRLKTVVNRLLADLFKAVDDLDIQMDEFWAAVGYIGQSAKANEFGLIVPGRARAFSRSAPRRGRAARGIEPAARRAPSRDRST